MEKNMLVRLKPHDPKKGMVLKQYTYQGIRFQAGRGWYQVNRKVAAYLENVHSIPGDEDTPLAFDVYTPDEARAMDEKDRKAARQVLPAEEALDVSHVSDEPPRAKSRTSPERDDTPRRQRRDSDRLPENAQADALEDDDVEDEVPRRRPSHRRASVVSRRPRAVIEDLDELDDDELDDEDEAFDEDEALEDEAPHRQVPRRRGAMTSRRPGAVVEDFEDEAFDEEFDDEAFEDDELEDAPVPARRRRSLPPKRRAPRARRIQRYTGEHDDRVDDDRPIRRVQGARQREALDALRNREARRTRPQRIVEDQYEEMPRSRPQAQYQDELHIRHARQMTAKLEETDALDDAMSYGDAEDSLPNNAKRNRHGSHGDAEDSLPTTTRSKHVSQRDAEDSLPGRATRYGDAEDSLPTRVRPSHGDAEDSLSTRDRHSYGDAEDSLPHCDRRMQHEVSPSSRHTADAQDDLDAVDHELDHRNVEEPARSDARSQRAQQPPSSAAQDELDALDDALDDRLEKASEDQRPGSAQLQHGQQHTGSSTQYSAEGAHGATSGTVSRDSRQPWPDDDPFVNGDTRHQAPAPGHEPAAAASASPRQGRRIYVPGQNTRGQASEAQASRLQPGRPRRTA
jgi:hypothetical protein